MRRRPGTLAPDRPAAGGTRRGTTGPPASPSSIVFLLPKQFPDHPLQVVARTCPGHAHDRLRGPASRRNPLKRTAPFLSSCTVFFFDSFWLSYTMTDRCCYRIKLLFHLFVGVQALAPPAAVQDRLRAALHRCGSHSASQETAKCKTPFEKRPCSPARFCLSSRFNQPLLERKTRRTKRALPSCCFPIHKTTQKSIRIPTSHRHYGFANASRKTT